MSLRIAFAGSAGTGKTFLGQRLAEELGLPFIEEGMRRRIEDGLRLEALGPAEHKQLIREMWDEQEAYETDADGFVADRSSLDFAAFWLHYDLHHDIQETDAWFERMCARAAAYDRILLMPWGVLPLEQDGVRSTNRWIQFRFQSILEGVLNRFAARGQVLRVPGITDAEQRLDFIVRHL